MASLPMPDFGRTKPAGQRAAARARGVAHMLLARAREARYGPDWAFHRIAKTLSLLRAPGEDERSQV